MEKQITPKLFAEIVGHEKAKAFLSQVLGAPPKAVLIAGPDGIGKCVASEERIQVADDTLPIGDVYDSLVRRTKNNVVVACPGSDGAERIVWGAGSTVFDGARQTTASCFRRSIAREVWRIRTTHGFRLTGTAEHRVRVWTERGFSWVSLSGLARLARTTTVWLCCVRPSLEFHTDEIRWRKVAELAKMSRKDKPLPRNVRGRARELSSPERKILSLELLLAAGPGLDFRDEEDAVECQEQLAELGILTRRNVGRLERAHQASYNWLLRQKAREDVGRKLTSFQKAARNGTPVAMLASALGRVAAAAVRAVPTVGLKRPFRELRECVVLDHQLLESVFRVLEDHGILDLLVGPLAADVEALQEFRRSCYFFDEFAAAERLEGRVNVFDAWVPGVHAFKSNMFLSHNSSLGRIYAAGVLCRSPRQVGTQGSLASEPCGACDSCQTLSGEGLHPDLFEESATGRGIEFVRQASEFVLAPPAMAKTRLALIPEIQDLPENLAACLIESLDSPSGRFAFTASAPSRVAPIIRHAAVLLPVCQPAPAEVEKLLTRLVPDLSPEDAKIIACRAESVRAAITLAQARIGCPTLSMEDLVEPAPKEMYLATVRAVLARNTPRIFELTAGLTRRMVPSMAYQKVGELLYDLYVIREGIQLPEFSIRHLDRVADDEAVKEFTRGFGDYLVPAARYLLRRAAEDVRLANLTMDLVGLSIMVTSASDDPASAAQSRGMLADRQVEELRQYQEKGAIKDYDHMRKLGVKKGKDTATGPEEEIDSVRDFFKKLETVDRKP